MTTADENLNFVFIFTGVKQPLAGQFCFKKDKMKKDKCVVPLCQSVQMNDPNLKFITFPTNEKKRKLWFDSIGRDGSKYAPRTSDWDHSFEVVIRPNIRNFRA